MKAATAIQMREIDRYCIENLSIPGIVLMENAALKVIDNLDIYKNKNFTIVCGTGNNGGDGLAIARHLIIKNKKASIFLVGSVERMSECCRINYNILNKMDVRINVIKNEMDIEKLKECISKSEVTIDSLFGTGLTGDVGGIHYQVIKAINEYSCTVVAVDIPSGLHCDRGEPLNICVKADMTVTFQLNKKGFLNNEAKKYTGNVIVEEIGIPQFVVEKFV